MQRLCTILLAAFTVLAAVAPDAAAQAARAGSAEAKSRLQQYEDRMRAQGPAPGELTASGLKVGASGNTTFLIAKVKQVIDGGQMIVGLDDSRTNTGRYNTWVLIKCKTKGRVDDEAINASQWKEVAGSDFLKVTGTKTLKLAGGGTRTVFVLEPYTPEKSPAKAVVVPVPFIGGRWSETKDISLVIVQRGEAFTAECAYVHPEHGDIRWKMTGTISKDRKMIGKLVHTKSPKGWVGQTRTGTLSADGKTITGRAVFEGGDHEFVWRKTADSKLFVGKWRIGEGKGADACYFILTAPNEAKRSDNPKVTGKWEVVGNEARIDWGEGWKDAIRNQDGKALKIAFGPGVNWGDTPTNTQAATKEAAPVIPRRKTR